MKVRKLPNGCLELSESWPLVSWSAGPLVRWSAGPKIRWSADQEDLATFAERAGEKTLS